MIPGCSRITILTGMVIKRVGLIFTLFFAVTVASGQSREEFHRKYGEPVSETFTVRPGVGVTVSYSATGSITEMLVSPQTSDLIKSRNRTLSRDVVQAVIDELVPKSERGKFLIGEMLNMTCLPAVDCAGTAENYEKVTIYYNAGVEGGVSYAVVQWKE